MNRSNDRVRVQQLELNNFKCFKGKHIIPMDADLILLVGPNGRGKTSIVEALEWALLGELKQRVGDKKEFVPQEYVNREHRHINRTHRPIDGASTAEHIKVVWSEHRGSSSIDLSASKASTEVVRRSEPFNAIWKEQGWEQSDRKKLLQSSTFLYSESLGSLIGLDIDTRRKVLDLFVPDSRRLSSLLREQLQSLSDDIEVAQSQLGISNLSVLESARTAAVRTFSKKWREHFGQDAGLLTKTDSPRSDLLKRLQILLKTLAKESNSVSEAELLEDLADAAIAERDRIDVRSKVETDSSDSSKWREVSGLLKQFSDLQQKLEYRPELLPAQESRPTSLGEEIAHIQAMRDEKREQRKRYWQEVNLEEDFSLPLPGISRLQVGSIPLLSSLKASYCVAALLQFAAEIGLQVPARERLQQLYAEEVLAWQSCERDLQIMEQKLAELRGLQERLVLTQRVKDVYSALEQCWVQIKPETPLPTTASGEIDMRAVQAQVPSGTPASVSAQSWGGLDAVAAAAKDWRARLLAWEEGKRTLEASPKKKELNQLLSDLKGLIPMLQSPLSDFETQLKSSLIKEHYEAALNSAARSVLARYAHVTGVRRYLSIKIDKSLTVAVQHEEDSAVSSGLPTLSRSQLSSVALSLALAANLGHPHLVAGFFCLDDVSDAFDLANLAADASILRALAYEEGAAHRQLILTNHNEHLTDRLVPLLLPPAGRSMHIVELYDDAEQGVGVKTWRVKGEERSTWTGRSPLRELFRERTSEG